jgi:hypothetical protein
MMAARLHAVPGQSEVLTNRAEVACVRRGARKPRVWRSRLCVGWWLFSVRLFTRAEAFTKTCFTPANSGSSAFAAG